MTNGPALIRWRKRWNRNLLRFLGSRARSVDVEDLAQETYLRLLRAPDLESVRNPEAYLISVANHVVAEWRQEQRIDAVPLESEDVAESRTLEVEIDVSISQRQIDAVLTGMSPVMRAVLLLRLRDDRSSKDIARALGLSERQVKRQLAHGYDRLRRALEGNRLR